MKDLIVKFKELAIKRSKINEMEKYIHTVFADEILKFFIEKGIEFEELKSGYTENVRRFQPVKKDSEKFGFQGYSHGDPELKTFSKCYFPVYYIKRNTLLVYFNWWKLPNLNMTVVWWNPEKETLEEFYERKLKKVLILL